MELRRFTPSGTDNISEPQILEEDEECITALGIGIDSHLSSGSIESEGGQDVVIKKLRTSLYFYYSRNFTTSGLGIDPRRIWSW